MKWSKRLLVLFVMFLMVFSTFTVQADTKGKLKNENNKNFSDVDDDFWAYDYIELMTKYGIIKGYNDNSFKPNAEVSREEFAKMMVLTLGLDLVNPSTPTFEDVPKTDWSYRYIEAAKNYLTGFRSNDELYFKPKYEAQREDMAVAIVKALDIDVSDADLSVLDDLKDENSISKNLRAYVAAAIDEGIMVGDNNKKFGATETLTRAEAATLLARLITDEKIVFDETKIVVDDTDSTTITTKKPVLTGKIKDGKIVLDWTEVNSTDFNYYKVVLSKDDSTPSYPNDGYAKAISNVTLTGCELAAGDSYNGGDLEGSIEDGEKYYISITAVFDDEEVTSNVIRLEIPEDTDDEEETSDRTPVLRSSLVTGGIKLSWTETDDDNFNYYKVVLSRSDSTPSYPSDGYITYITDNDTTTFTIKDNMDYTNGDFEELQSGVRYYVAITAVYSNDQQYNTSNVLTVTLP